MRNVSIGNLVWFYSSLVAILFIIIYINQEELDLDRLTAPVQNSSIFDGGRLLSVEPKINVENESVEILNCADRRLPKTTTESPITVVTMFFHIKSKHSLDSYRQWIQNFIGKVNSAMVIFTSLPKSWWDQLPMAARGSKKLLVFCPEIWNLSVYARPVPLKSNQSNHTERNWRKAYQDQKGIDGEAHLHSPDLYAVWNSRAWLTDFVAESNPFSSKYFFSVDIGAFRGGHNFRVWPSIDTVESIFTNVSEDRLLVSLMGQPNLEQVCQKRNLSLGPVYAVVVQGGIFGGQREAVGWWKKVFIESHDFFYSKGWFVGKDQNIMNALFYAYAEHFLLIRSYIAGGNCGGDQWFYFEHALASKRERYGGCSTVPIVYDASSWPWGTTSCTKMSATMVVSTINVVPTTMTMGASTKDVEG